MKQFALAAFVLLCVPGVPSSPWPGTPPQEPAEHLSQGEGYGLVRTVNTAEAEYLASRQSYGNLEEVLGQRMFHPPAAHISVPTAADAFSGTVKDYKLTVIPSQGERHYSVSLVRADRLCGPAYFSDESAVIYTGVALGCPPPTTNSASPKA